ncbi:glycosyltransferase [Anaerotruncus sp. 1XD42-93]|jgi:glycosyltransferase involved in cell wall biosynthesis|uniref:glycosyltransferase family 2 protein n=1 Tax=Anaerotruncus sp. 1XD42-93 TaxID=2320853 RepID=UPI000EA25D14|nr:glycosyltransferase [Anaerotruncus sp. 1XD42-93]NBK19946.1 glycosyltransferase [Anaerotruncus sp. 1XD42-93]RKJ76800.1 glycosyltransferase [Anaerotruncus sp. 1XD22-93]
MNLISVVVPVYNAGPYLRQCLDSIAAQTYSHMEVILVDDASTDGSGQICKEYAERDERFQYVRFPANRGPSAARNEGVGRAAGAFLSFVDADDYVEPDLLEKLYRSLTESGADISTCGADGIRLESGPARTYSRAEAVCCLAKGAPFNHVPWGKLYCAELARACPFDENVFYSEDLLFLYEALKRSEKVSCIPDVLYHYVSREGSQMRSGMSGRKCTALAVQELVCRDAAIAFPKAEPHFRRLALETDRCMAMLTVKAGAEDGTAYAYLKKLSNDARRHFSWRALSLFPSKKDAAAALALCVGAMVFWGIAAAFLRLKGLKGG